MNTLRVVFYSQIQLCIAPKQNIYKRCTQYYRVGHNYNSSQSNMRDKPLFKIKQFTDDQKELTADKIVGTFCKHSYFYNR